MKFEMFRGNRAFSNREHNHSLDAPIPLFSEKNHLILCSFTRLIQVKCEYII